MDENKPGLCARRETHVGFGRQLFAIGHALQLAGLIDFDRIAGIGRENVDGLTIKFCSRSPGMSNGISGLVRALKPG